MIESPHQSEVTSLIHTTLKSGASVRMKIDGDSMHPWLRQGDTVVVGIAEAEQLVPGDIVVIRKKGDFVTHRLIAVNQHGWQTKGDASSMPDPPVSKDEIMGRVESIERGSSNVHLNVGWLRTASHFLAWIARKEARAYQIYRNSLFARDNRLKWLAWLIVIPFRLPLWMLAAFRR